MIDYKDQVFYLESILNDQKRFFISIFPGRYFFFVLQAFIIPKFKKVYQAIAYIYSIPFYKSKAGTNILPVLYAEYT